MIPGKPMRRLVATALVAGVLAVLPVTPAAAAAPAISDLDWTTTAGHVTGTVASDAPWVFVDLGSGSGSGTEASWVGPEVFVPIDQATGTGRFDLETWGLRSSSGTPQTIVAAASCTANATSACAFGELTHSTWFQPTDVRPTITVSDTTIGPGQTLSITSSDPNGGGDLRVSWRDYTGLDTQYGGMPRFPAGSRIIDRNGTTSLPFGEGDSALVVRRCLAGSQTHCDDFEIPISIDVGVNQHLFAFRDHDTGGATPERKVVHYRIVPDAYGLVTMESVTLHHRESGTVREWPVTTTHSGGGSFSFALDATGLPSGNYVVHGTASIAYSQYGTVSGPLRHAWGETWEPGLHLFVQPDPPVVTSIASTPYIRRDDHFNHSRAATFTASGHNAAGNERFVLLDSAGTVVSEVYATARQGDPDTWTATFTGWDEEAGKLPRGQYTVRLRDADGRLSQAAATVQIQDLVKREWAGGSTAQDSRVRTWLGSCGKLRSPSRRTWWEESNGYYSNARCRTTDSYESMVVTRNRMRIPGAVRHEAPRLMVYGGASRTRPTSKLRVTPVTNPETTAFLGARLGSAVGWHTAPEHTRPVDVVRRDGVPYAMWQAATVDGRQYDVKRFRIELEYWVWR